MDRRYTEMMALQMDSVHFEHLTKRERTKHVDQEKRELREEEGIYDRSF